MDSTCLDALGQTMLFGALDDAPLLALAKASRSKSYAKGQVVLFAGDRGGDVLVVASGRLKVVARSPEGTDMVLTIALPGDSLGELSLFDLEPRSATIEAQEASVVVTVPHEVVRSVIRSHPDLAEELLRQQASIVRRLSGLVGDLVFLDLPRRVAKYVVERSGGNGHADLGLSQTELAAAVGGVRQSVNAALRTFERRGWIRVEGRIVEVRDEAAMVDYLAAER